jgi:hypothetical protein
MASVFETPGWRASKVCMSVSSMSRVVRTTSVCQIDASLHLRRFVANDPRLLPAPTAGTGGGNDRPPDRVLPRPAGQAGDTVTEIAVLHDRACLVGRTYDRDDLAGCDQIVAR